MVNKNHQTLFVKLVFETYNRQGMNAFSPTVAEHRSVLMSNVC